LTFGCHLSPHSLIEADELSQWLCYVNDTIKGGIGIFIIIIIIAKITMACLVKEMRPDRDGEY